MFLAALEALLPWQNFLITQQYGSILCSHLTHMFIGTKCITGLSCCHGKAVMLLRKRHNSILTSYSGNTVTHQNQVLTSERDSLVRNISINRISYKKSFSQTHTTTTSPLPHFCGQILDTLHCPEHVM